MFSVKRSVDNVFEVSVVFCEKFNLTLISGDSLADVITNAAVGLGKIILVLDPFLNVACNVGLVGTVKGALSIFASLVLPFPSEVTVEIEFLHP